MPYPKKSFSKGKEAQAKTMRHITKSKRKKNLKQTYPEVLDASVNAFDGDSDVAVTAVAVKQENKNK